LIPAGHYLESRWPGSSIPATTDIRIAWTMREDALAKGFAAEKLLLKRVNPPDPAAANL
jgi:hypothetical protein